MVAIDYLVMTFPEISTTQSYEPVLRALVRGDERGMRHGYRGVQGKQSFWGYSDWARRFLLVLTGAYADECAPKIPLALDPYVSIARLDIQSTFRVPRADRFIAETRGSKRYKATRIIPDDGFGSTLYIGSRSSNLFARTYNKSFEANIPPDAQGELLRVEFCLRDSYADRAWKDYRLGNLDEVFGSLVSRMFEEQSAARIIEYAQSVLSERDIEFLKADARDWRERRLAWLENVVVPSINRLVADSPELTARIWDILDIIPKPGYNRK